jgi:hypothetical protein
MLIERSNFSRRVQPDRDRRIVGFIRQRRMDSLDEAKPQGISHTFAKVLTNLRTSISRVLAR